MAKGLLRDAYIENARLRDERGGEQSPAAGVRRSGSDEQLELSSSAAHTIQFFIRESP